MKSFLFILVLYSINSFAQKHDYIWVLGSKNTGNGDTCLNGMELNFENELKINRQSINRVMDSHNNSFSDINGNLQYYTNGCCILNSKDSIIENGDSLNLIYDYGAYCKGFQQPYGIPFPNASLFLTQEDSTLMYLSLETITNPNKPPYVFSPNVLSSLIDTNRKKVVFKNRSLLKGKLSLCREGLTACKHIDNKSWWVICRNNVDSLFYILLVKKDSFSYATQRIGNFYYSGEASQSTFSPNGKYYAWYSRTNGLEIMHFNRESGLLSDYQKIAVIDTSKFGLGGLSISPNNRFIYVSTEWDLLQFDLESNDISKSAEDIQHYSGFDCNCGTFLSKPLYYQMQLGPDCRIYMSPSSSAACMHVILNPDLKGKQCNFIEGGIKLPSGNFSSVPQFPNYRIDQPYPCDSTIKFVTANVDLGDNYLISKVFPNPVNDVLNVDIEIYGEKDPRLELIDVNGRVILKSNLLSFTSHYSFDIHSLSTGMYFYKIVSKNGIIKNGRVVKI